MSRQFSERGLPVTAFERALVAQADTARLTDASGQWVLLAQKVGLEAIVAIMDEFGTEKIHVPTRQQFIQALYRPVRNAQIQALAAGGMPAGEIAQRMGMCRQMVHNILAAGANAEDGIGQPEVVKARP